MRVGCHRKRTEGSRTKKTKATGAAMRAVWVATSSDTEPPLITRSRSANLCTSREDGVSGRIDVFVWLA